MKLFIRPRAVPSRPINYYKSEASLIAWLYRLPVVFIRQLIWQVWREIQTYLIAALITIGLAILLIVRFIFFGSTGSVSEDIESTIIPFEGFLTWVGLYIELFFIGIVLYRAARSALSLVRQQYVVVLPRRELRKKR